MKPYYMTKSQEEINAEQDGKVSAKPLTKHMTPIQLYEKYAPDMCKTEAVMSVLKEYKYFDDDHVKRCFEAYKTLSFYTKNGLVKWGRSESVFIVTMIQLPTARAYLDLQSAGLMFTKQEVDCLFGNEEEKMSPNDFYTAVAKSYVDKCKRIK